MSPLRRLRDLLGSAAIVDVDTLISFVVDASPVGMMIVDDHGVILFANRRIELDFGYRTEELAGHSVDVLVPAALSGDHAFHRQAYLGHAEPRQMGAGRPLSGRRLDGSEFPVEVGLTPVRVESRTLVLTSVIDITAQRIAEARAMRGLEERVTFEAVVAEISAAFVNLPHDALDAAITDALRRIVETLDLDRAVLFLRDDANDDFQPAQRWARPGVRTTTESISVRDEFPWAWRRIVAGDVASYTRVSDIPDEVTQKSVRTYGARSGVTVGFSIDGRLAGCVAFASTREEREWPAEALNRLQLVSRVFAGGIARMRADKALGDALAEVKRLTESLKAENTYLRSEVRQVLEGAQIVGHSPAMLQVQEMVSQVAPTDSTVLLRGETGTGKELFAGLIHEQSARRDRLMVRVNCAAIPATLLESELFGREKGAYTGALTRQTGRFELADKSTIFLDEIGDLPLDVQVKLLRVLEDRQVERLGSSRSVKVDVRIVAATHRNLEEMVAAGRFREDLFYRLNVFPIRVPPLRERPGDIPLLAWRFVDEFARRFGKPVTSLDKGSLAELLRHSWPGNVRELRNVVERAMIVARPGVPLVISLAPSALAPSAPKSAKLVDVEVAHMRSVLEASGWRIRGAGGAAERLGLKPSTLETRMAKLGVRRPVRSE